MSVQQKIGLDAKTTTYIIFFITVVVTSKCQKIFDCKDVKYLKFVCLYFCFLFSIYIYYVEVIFFKSLDKPNIELRATMLYEIIMAR